MVDWFFRWGLWYLIGAMLFYLQIIMPFHMMVDTILSGL